LIILDLTEYSKEALWQLLEEAIHATVMYPPHKAYTRDTILPETPNITPQELAQRLTIPLGEAIIILKELTDK
jgi:ribosomal protein S25